MKKIADYASWTGPLAVVVTLTGWLIAGFLPLPIGPGDPAEVASMFLDDATRVRVTTYCIFLLVMSWACRQANKSLEGAAS